MVWISVDDFGMLLETIILDDFGTQTEAIYIVILFAQKCAVEQDSKNPPFGGRLPLSFLALVLAHLFASPEC